MKFNRAIPWLVTLLALAGLLSPVLGQTNIANNAAEMSGKIVMLADGGTPRTVTNLFTFSRSPSPPFAVVSSSAKVSNLDADTVDGLDSTRFVWATITSTATGTQNDFAPGITAGQPTLVRLNNASLLTITGISAGVDGQRLKLISVGAGEVDLSHQNAGSTTAADRFINYVTSGITPLAPGAGQAEYVYDGVTLRWRMIDHDQGAAIAITFNAGDYTASAGNWTLAGGDVILDAFYLKNRIYTHYFNYQTTTISAGPVSLRKTIPNSWTFAVASSNRIGGTENNVVQNGQWAQAQSGASTIFFFHDALSTVFTASADNASTFGQLSAPLN